MLSVDDDKKQKQQHSVEQDFTDHRFHLVVHVGLVFGFSHLIRCHVVVGVVACGQSNKTTKQFTKNSKNFNKELPDFIPKFFLSPQLRIS